MNFLDFCDNSNVLKIIMFAIELLRIIFVVIPIGLIIMVSVDLAKNVIAGREDDMKKNVNIALKRVLMAFLVFFIPSIVGFVINGLGNNYVGYFDCITNANKKKIAEQEKIEKEQKEEERNNRVNQNIDDINQENIHSSSNGSGNILDDTNMKKNGVYDGTIYVGDSRTVRMCNSVGITNDTSTKPSFATGKNELCIASSGKAIEWFNDTAKNNIFFLSEDTSKKYNIVINLGVNSLYGNKMSSVYNYINSYNSLVSKVGNSRIVIISVTQTDEELMNKFGFSGINDSTVVSFNKKLIEGLDSSISYCDVHTYLEKVGFAWDSSKNDGLHYDKTTDKKIYNKIKECLS